METTAIEVQMPLVKAEAEIMHELISSIPLGAMKSSETAKYMWSIRCKLEAALKSFPTVPAKKQEGDK